MDGRWMNCVGGWTDAWMDEWTDGGMDDGLQSRTTVRSGSTPASPAQLLCHLGQVTIAL